MAKAWMAALAALAQIAGDPAARARLEEARAALASYKLCPPACLDALEALHRQYPRDPELVPLLRRVYEQRREWQELIRLERASPDAGSLESRARLAAWLSHSGQYREAAELLEQLLAERPAHAGLARFSGLALFMTGEHERAIPRLELAMARLSGSEAAEAGTARALIDLHRGEPEAAARRLRQVLAAAPDYAPAHGALGRALAAAGDQDGARQSVERSAALRARASAEESRALRLASQSQTASQVCRARRFDECERVVQEMIAEAEPGVAVQLYRYLAEVRTAAGRPEAAREALAKAAELSQGSQR
jgi:tetratricopeptide (TPR) repeat protein